MTDEQQDAEPEAPGIAREVLGSLVTALLPGQSVRRLELRARWLVLVTSFCGFMAALESDARDRQVELIIAVVAFWLAAFWNAGGNQPWWRRRDDD